MTIAKTALPGSESAGRADAKPNGGATSQLGFILDAHDRLLAQILDLVTLMKGMNPPGFAFPARLGPHVRHILEHYTALFDALDALKSGVVACIDYDARARNRLIESDCDAARASISSVRNHIASGRTAFPVDLATPMSTRLTSGACGDVMVTAPTSLGRELLFLESHTVHHMALIAQYVRAYGVALEPHFGMAPATIAFERLGSRTGHR